MNKSKLLDKAWLGTIGTIDISFTIEVVLGITYIGPNVKKSAIENSSPNIGCTLPASFSTVPPEMAKAMMANRTNPTPVIKNPEKATHVLVPANCPIIGANMILPAPRNMANNIKPTAISCPIDKVLFM